MHVTWQGGVQHFNNQTTTMDTEKWIVITQGEKRKTTIQSKKRTITMQGKEQTIATQGEKQALITQCKVRWITNVEWTIAI